MFLAMRKGDKKVDCWNLVWVIETKRPHLAAFNKVFSTFASEMLLWSRLHPRIAGRICARGWFSSRWGRHPIIDRCTCFGVLLRTKQRNMQWTPTAQSCQTISTFVVKSLTIKFVCTKTPSKLRRHVQLSCACSTSIWRLQIRSPPSENKMNKIGVSLVSAPHSAWSYKINVTMVFGRSDASIEMSSQQRCSLCSFHVCQLKLQNLMHLFYVLSVSPNRWVNGLVKTKWLGPGHCRRRSSPRSGGTQLSPIPRPHVPAGVQPPPICVVHPCWVGGSRPCNHVTHRTWANQHHPVYWWHRNLWHHSTGQHVTNTLRRGGGQHLPALCSTIFCHHIHIHLARPQRPAPRSSASRRRGTGRSPHASLLNASQQLPAGGNIARFPRRCICGSPATSGAPNLRPFAKPRVPPNAHPTQRRQNTCLESSKPNPPQTSRLWGRTSGSVAMKPLRTNKGSWF